MARMDKVCPCNSCGQTARCVSHDTFRFYCNRCLPYFIRQNLYWIEENETAPVAEPRTLSREPITNVTMNRGVKSKHVDIK